MSRTARKIADVIALAIAGQTGILAGKQQARERQMQEAEQQRRARMQEQDQQDQLFGRAAGLEQQGLDRQAEAFRMLIPQADEESQPGMLQSYNAMVAQQGPATQRYQQFLQGQLPGGGAGPLAPGASPYSSRYVQPGAGAAMGAPAAVPVAAPAFKAKDPNKERARGSIAKRIADARANALQVDQALADEIGRLETAYTAKKIADPEAEAALASLAGRSETKFQLQEKARRDREDTDKKQAEATLALRQAELASVQAGRDAQKEAKAATEARLMGDSLRRPYADALKSGKPELVLKFGARYGAHLSKNKQYFPEGVPDDLDPTARDIVRLRPDPKATPEQQWAAAEGGARVPEVEIVEKETPDQIATRTLAAARQEADLSPRARQDLTKGMLPRLWATVMNPKVSDESRAEAFEVVSALQKENPALEGLFPKSLPSLQRVSPELKHRIERESILDARYKEENDRKRQRFTLALEKDRASLAKSEQTWQRNAGKFTDAQKQMFKGLGDDYKAALKTLDALNKIPPADRALVPDYDKQLEAATEARDEAKAALNTATLTGRPDEQFVPSKRGPRNELGFNPFQMKTIKILQGSGLSFEEAANEVRRRGN